MNADLEKTLDEMGPEYRAVVARLRAGREMEGFGRPVFCLEFKALRPILVAASLLVLAGLGIYCLRSPDTERETRVEIGPASAGREYLLAQAGNEAAVREMIARQNPDGSWQNDFLTRRNAEALRACTDAASRIAYKKAMRNLRLRGVL